MSGGSNQCPVGANQCPVSSVRHRFLAVCHQALFGGGGQPVLCHGLCNGVCWIELPYMFVFICDHGGLLFVILCHISYCDLYIGLYTNVNW